jgi:hypothetical protein
MENFIIQDQREIKNKMGGRRPEGRITDSRNTRTEETSRRQRRMKTFLREARTQKGCSAIDGMAMEYYDIVFHFAARLAADTTFVSCNRKGSLVTVRNSLYTTCTASYLFLRK